MEIDPEEANLLRDIDARLTEIEKTKNDAAVDDTERADVAEEQQELEQVGKEVLKHD